MNVTTVAYCPRCGRPADSRIDRTAKGVAEAHCICPDGHLWVTRWNVED